MKANSIEVSLPKSKTVCGYEIKKMPLGAFLSATQLLQDAPADLIEAMYPGESLSGFLKRLKTLDRNGLQALALRALSVLPEKALALFGQLSGIESHQLINDPAVGLDGIADMALAWMEVNGVENFIQSVRTIISRARVLTAAKAGFNG